MQNSNKTIEIDDLFSKIYNYPSSEDIYVQFQKESDIDPEDITKKKDTIVTDKDASWNEKSANKDRSGNDLDVPGSELDDDQENIGSEDEENNFYSIGGDNHNDLEEDK